MSHQRGATDAPGTMAPSSRRPSRPGAKHRHDLPHSVHLREALAARLGGSGHRITANRMTLVEILASAGRPLTIPEILALDPALAQSSAYRNLMVLEHAGVVHRIVTSDEFARFELAEDLTGDHHHHLICSNCGSVADVPASAGLEASVRDAAAAISRQTGFRTLAHRVDLVGLCRDCGP